MNALLLSKKLFCLIEGRVQAVQTACVVFNPESFSSKPKFEVSSQHSGAAEGGNGTDTF